MRGIGIIGENWRRLGEDRRGSFAIVFAVVVPALALAVGMALNTAQLLITKSNLLNALDAAVTSTARDLTTGAIEEKDARKTVEAFLFANGETVFAKGDRIQLAGLTVDRNTGTVRATAEAEIDFVFPLFRIGDTHRVSVDAAALYSDKKIEVAMMLDITGSMAGRKIRDLQAAAKNAVDTFLRGQDADDPRIRVALVPYANGVNAGMLANTVHVERNRRSPSEPPALGDPRTVAATPSDGCATEREGRFQFSDAGPYTAMVNRDYRLAYCPTSPLRPLSADRAALKAAIDGFSASGHTAGPVGIQWSWYLLSREWAEVLPKNAKPARADPKSVAKYAILMTDGEFNTAYADVDHGEDPRGQPARSRRNAERLCTEMKRDGIEVFAIGFQLDQAAAKAVMKDCASDDRGGVKHYFAASTGAELDAAYQEIARNIERLALTK